MECMERIYRMKDKNGGMGGVNVKIGGSRVEK